MVPWRLRYHLTLRDLAEMFLVRGLVFSHEAVREWEAKLAPMLADELRQRRHGRGGARGRHWHVDETYLKVRGRWCYLYRAIDRDGQLIDTMLSEHRNMAISIARLGPEKGLSFYADWTDRIARGELPANRPRRPEGLEVLSGLAPIGLFGRLG